MWGRKLGVGWGVEVGHHGPPANVQVMIDSHACCADFIAVETLYSAEAMLQDSNFVPLVKLLVLIASLPLLTQNSCLRAWLDT